MDGNESDVPRPKRNAKSYAPVKHVSRTALTKVRRGDNLGRVGTGKNQIARC
jgi:hypothetical protein